MNKKIALGLSGGVDSSAAAVLLKKGGFDVTGVFLETRLSEKEQADKKRAGEVCARLSIPFLSADLSSDFKEKVISPFVDVYLSGETPNPCVFCNPNIKIKGLIEIADRIGADFAATGHYAGVFKNESGRYYLKRAAFAQKDQSYFLYGLSQSQLARLIFPLFDAQSKDWVKDYASKEGIIDAATDSQEICFLEGESYASFIERHVGSKPEPGNFVDADGHVMGRHSGVANYTIGQRKGLGAFGRPVFVSKIDPVSNEITLGNFEDALCDSFYVHNLNFLYFDRLEDTIKTSVRISSRSPLFDCHVSREGDKVHVKTLVPCRAVSGQSAVFCDGGDLLFGGTIKRI